MLIQSQAPAYLPSAYVKDRLDMDKRHYFPLLSDYSIAFSHILYCSLRLSFIIFCSRVCSFEKVYREKLRARRTIKIMLYKQKSVIVLSSSHAQIVDLVETRQDQRWWLWCLWFTRVTFLAHSLRVEGYLVYHCFFLVFAWTCSSASYCTVACTQQCMPWRRGVFFLLWWYHLRSSIRTRKHENQDEQRSWLCMFAL